MINRVIITSAAVFLGGLFTIGYGHITDPFLIPFQDYDQMLEYQKVEYLSQQRTANFFKDKGFTLLIVGGSLFSLSLLLKTARKRINPS